MPELVPWIEIEESLLFLVVLVCFFCEFDGFVVDELRGWFVCAATTVDAAIRMVVKKIRRFINKVFLFLIYKYSPNANLLPI